MLAPAVPGAQEAGETRTGEASLAFIDEDVGRSVGDPSDPVGIRSEGAAQIGIQWPIALELTRELGEAQQGVEVHDHADRRARALQDRRPALDRLVSRRSRPSRRRRLHPDR
jgi:hypothetical protein